MLRRMLRDIEARAESQARELWELARACRIGSVIRPYIEALA